MTAKAQKAAFLRDETALSQVETALIFGCRARDVNEFIEPSFYLNGRPKYRQAAVLKVRDRMIEAKGKMDARNRRMAQTA